MIPVLLISASEGRDRTGPVSIDTYGNVRSTDTGWEMRGATPYGFGVFGGWSFGGKPGTLSAPLATAPASILIRTRSGSTTTTHHIAGASGEAGGATVTHDGENLTIGTTGEVEVVGLVTYPEELTAVEVDRVSAMETWSWDRILYRPVGSVQRIQRPSPIAVGRMQRSSPIAVGRIQRTNGGAT